MNDETKARIRASIAEAQIGIDKLVLPGSLRVAVLILEKSESPEELVQKALADRQRSGLSAANNNEVSASLMLPSLKRFASCRFSTPIKKRLPTSLPSRIRQMA
jgi:hypothetical protein